MTSIQDLIANTPDGTSIDPNLSFSGTMVLNGPGAVRIAGAFEGSIIAKAGTVIVQEGGVVRGTITAANIIVSGTVTTSASNGDKDHIEATQNLALAGTAKVASPMIGYGSIAMDFGASIMGGMKPLTKTDAADIATAPPAIEKVLSIEAARTPAHAIPLRPQASASAISDAAHRDVMSSPIRTGTSNEVLDETLVPIPG